MPPCLQFTFSMLDDFGFLILFDKIQFLKFSQTFLAFISRDPFCKFILWPRVSSRFVALRHRNFICTLTIIIVFDIFGTL